jgi:hypothetical protein
MEHIGNDQKLKLTSRGCSVLSGEAAKSLYVPEMAEIFFSLIESFSLGSIKTF